jgi:putative transposase
MTVIRYIHQNPVKAGIVKRAAEWKWSSNCGYYGKIYYPVALLDADLILGSISEKREKAIEQFIFTMNWRITIPVWMIYISYG